MKEYIERGKLIGDILHALLVVPSEDFLLPPEKDILRMIKSEPAADVREVKRCKDCIYAYPYGLEIKCTKHSGHSEKFGEDASYSEFHDWNWFCADAQERRKK